MSNKNKLSIRFDLEGDDYDMWKTIAKERNVKYGNLLFLILLKEEYDRLKLKAEANKTEVVGVIS